MPKIPRCPIHGYDIEPDICAACSISKLTAAMLNGEPCPEARPPDRMDSETTALEDGSVLIMYRPVYFDA